MDNPEFQRVVSIVMTDGEYQNVNVRGVDLWMLLCACQQMMVVGGIHKPLKDAYRDLGKRLEAIVTTIHPDAKTLAAAGWQNYVRVDEPYPELLIPFNRYWFADDDDDDDEGDAYNPDYTDE